MRRRPLLAIRSRPRLSFSSSSQTSFGLAPSCRSRWAVALKTSVYGVVAQRVAWPGAVRRSVVASQSIAARWKPGSTAPAATASSVNR